MSLSAESSIAQHSSRERGSSRLNFLGNREILHMAQKVQIKERNEKRKKTYTVNSENVL